MRTCLVSFLAVVITATVGLSVLRPAIGAEPYNPYDVDWLEQKAAPEGQDAGPTDSKEEAKGRALDLFGKLPLSFIENKGQLNEGVWLQKSPGTPALQSDFARDMQGEGGIRMLDTLTSAAIACERRNR